MNQWGSQQKNSRNSSNSVKRTSAVWKNNSSSMSNSARMIANEARFRLVSMFLSNTMDYLGLVSMFFVSTIDDLEFLYQRKH